MNDLTIHISWEYFLGIMSSLILVAWYSNGRFTKLETSFKWIETLLKELKINVNNETTKAFASHSPVSLTGIGTRFLSESGIKDFIDADKSLMASCEEKKDNNPYEVQNHIFSLFDRLVFPADVDEKIKKYAFEKGIGTDILRRVGAIYFRDICLNSFGMKREDVDRHDPLLNS